MLEVHFASFVLSLFVYFFVGFVCVCAQCMPFYLCIMTNLLLKSDRRALYINKCSKQKLIFNGNIVQPHSVGCNEFKGLSDSEYLR